MNLAKKVINYLKEPDVYIGGKKNPYLLRWFIIPRNPLFNIYLHKFLRDDDDRALHDHPWISLSYLLRGKLKEHVFLRKNSLSTYCIRRERGEWVFRRPTHAHRIQLYRDASGRPLPAWTIFITGPRVRKWGFHCPQGWRLHSLFTASTDPTVIGPGCD